MDDKSATINERVAAAVTEFKAALDLLPPSREASIALTHLDTAQLWARAYVARQLGS